MVILIYIFKAILLPAANKYLAWATYSLVWWLCDWY